jgi:large subunit ribosomal protein L2
MGIRSYKPTSPARRGSSVVDYSDVDQVEPLGSKVESRRRSNGRNNLGRVTCRHKGGGVKRLYRHVDFRRDKREIEAKVEYIEYDPNRTAFIARVLYKDGERRYILAPNGLKKGDRVVAGDKVDVQPGNCGMLKFLPLGTMVHNVEMKPGKGGQMARSAGAMAQLVGRVDGYAQLRMPSGEMRRVPEECFASVGQVSNLDHGNVNWGKAGRMRWRGIRPTVRGTAMNPVDHPHGGGEGRTKGGRHPVTPWAKPTKGYKTRKNKRTDRDIIRRRNSVKTTEQ